MPQAVFWVKVNGQEITSTLAPILISIVITDSEGGENDTLELELDDEGGSIELPPTNAPVEAGIAYEDDNGELLGPPVQFSGKVDKPTSSFARGQGLTMRISAKSADVKGKPKAPQQKHHDKGKFSDVAKKFGKEAGLEVEVPNGVDFERDYWAMQSESFLNWGWRMAEEQGLTFKVRDGRAIFAQRSAGTSLSGQPLPQVVAEYWGNIISGNMSPEDDRESWEKFQTRYYDPKEAKYKVEDVEARSRPGSVTHIDRFTRANKDTAKARAKSNSDEADRDRGGGTIVIDGEPTAQAEAECLVVGVRAGIDGTYRIASAKHSLRRGEGYRTELELKQPAGEAGTDNRGKSGGGSGSNSGGTSSGSGGSTPPEFTTPDF